MLNVIYRMFQLEKMTHRLFFWMIVFVILNSTIFLALYKTIDRQDRFELEHTRLSQSLENQQEIVVDWAHDRMNEVIHLTQVEETRTKDYEAMGSLFQYHAAYLSHTAAFVFLDEEGYVILDSALEEPLIHSQKSLREREYFIAGEAGEKYVSDIVVSKSSGSPVVIFSAPVETMDQEFGGVVFGAVSLSTMNTLLQNTALGKTGNVLFVDREGIIFSGLSDDTTTLSAELQTDIIAAALAGEEPDQPYENANGALVIGEYLPLFGDRYFLIHEIDVDEILQPHYEMGRVIVAASSVVALIGMFFIYFVIRDNTHSLVYFTEAIQRVTKGDYAYEMNERIYKKSPKEIQSIMDTFEEMTVKVEENKQALVRLSEVDELTGVYNRRTFTTSMKKKWKAAYEQKTPLSIAFIDIDFFKQLNDAYGHIVGDEVLIRITEGIERALIGTGGNLYRYGGEEFVALLPNTDKRAAFTYAESIRQIVKMKRIYHKDGTPVTVSVGVSTIIPETLDGAEMFLKRADEALYKAKEAGRNQVVVTDIH